MALAAWAAATSSRMARSLASRISSSFSVASWCAATLCVATFSATSAAAPIVDSTSVANRCLDRCFTQLAAAASTAVVFAAVLFAAVARRAISQRRAFPTDCSDAASTAVAFPAACPALAFAAVASTAVTFAAIAFAAVAFAAVERRAISHRRALSSADWCDAASPAVTFAAVAFAAIAVAAVAFAPVAFAAVLLTAVARRAISHRRAFPIDCSDAASTAVVFTAAAFADVAFADVAGVALAGVALAGVARRAMSHRRAFATVCSDAVITAAAVLAGGAAGCTLVATLDSSSIVPAWFNRAHLAADGPSKATGTIEVFCAGGLEAASVVATSDATSSPVGCRSVALVVRLWLMCRFAAARRAAVFAAIALMSPVLGALAGAAELVCLDGGGASAPVAGATADLAGDAHSHRSGGQMDGVLPQLLTHQLESCGALSELSAAQVVGSPPSTRAVGRRCRTEVA